MGKLQVRQSVTRKRWSLRKGLVVKPWDVNRASVLNLGYRWELQLFGIEGVMASNDEFLIINANAM